MAFYSLVNIISLSLSIPYLCVALCAILLALELFHVHFGKYIFIVLIQFIMMQFCRWEFMGVDSIFDIIRRCNITENSMICLALLIFLPLFFSYSIPLTLRVVDVSIGNWLHNFTYWLLMFSVMVSICCKKKWTVHLHVYKCIWTQDYILVMYYSGLVEWWFLSSNIHDLTSIEWLEMFWVPGIVSPFWEGFKSK